MERLEILELLADAGELDRSAGYVRHRQRSAPARVAVEFREDDAGEIYFFEERFRDIDRVLTRHRIAHQQRFGRIDLLRDIPEFLHQFGIDVHASGRVHDEIRGAFRARRGEAVPRHTGRVFMSLFRVDGDVDLLAQQLQLADRRGTAQVRRDQ